MLAYLHMTTAQPFLSIEGMLFYAHEQHKHRITVCKVKRKGRLLRPAPKRKREIGILPGVLCYLTDLSPTDNFRGQIGRDLTGHGAHGGALQLVQLGLNLGLDLIGQLLVLFAFFPVAHGRKEIPHDLVAGFVVDLGKRQCESQLPVDLVGQPLLEVFPLGERPQHANHEIHVIPARIDLLGCGLQHLLFYCFCYCYGLGGFHFLLPVKVCPAHGYNISIDSDNASRNLSNFELIFLDSCKHCKHLKKVCQQNLFYFCA